jgi:hypothetical protein
LNAIPVLRSITPCCTAPGMTEPVVPPLPACVTPDKRSAIRGPGLSHAPSVPDHRVWDTSRPVMTRATNPRCGARLHGGDEV